MTNIFLSFFSGTILDKCPYRRHTSNCIKHIEWSRILCVKTVFKLNIKVRYANIFIGIKTFSFKIVISVHLTVTIRCLLHTIVKCHITFQNIEHLDVDISRIMKFNIIKLSHSELLPVVFALLFKLTRSRIYLALFLVTTVNITVESIRYMMFKHILNENSICNIYHWYHTCRGAEVLNGEAWVFEIKMSMNFKCQGSTISRNFVPKHANYRHALC